MTTKFKPLYLFVIASNSLLLAGSIASKNFDLIQLLIIQWCGLCGVFIIYRFNDFIDQTHDFKFNVRRLFSHKLHLIFLLQFFIFTIPAVFIFLSPFRILLLSAICILGILYSVNFRINQTNFRLKNIFIVKNFYIGVLWGGLILVGANGFANSYITGLFIFTSLQVFMGSIIRDIPDLETDRKENVKSFPVVMGIKKTLLLLYAFNLLSFGIGYIFERRMEFMLLMGITIGWRFISLVCTQSNPNSRLWTQTFNLLTCFLIFVLSSCLLLYELY